MVNDARQPAEFSRLVAVDRIGADERVEEITATEAERVALAERFGWVSLERLDATIVLRRLKSDLIRVSGRYEAALQQSCVVTLKPVPAEVAGSFTELHGVEADESVVVALSPTEEDPPEPIIDGRIDIGEAVVQQLAVTLDPYPRAADAMLPEALSGAAQGGEEEKRRSPFAALAELQRPKREDEA